MMSPTLSPPVGVPMLRFSMDALPGGDRDAILFRELIRRHIVALENQPLTKGRRSLRHAAGIALPDLGVAVSSSSPQTVRRTPQLVADGNDNLRLIIPRNSATAAIATQFGREITIDSGGAVVLLNSEQNSITFPSSTRLLVLNMRRQRLRPLLHDFDAVLARPIPKQVETLQLLSNYIDGLIKTPTLSADAARLVVTQIYDLAALTMGATRDAAEIAKGRGLRVARLRAIKADIADRLVGLDLSVQTVAARQGVSPRYVQMLFEQGGTTFSRYVISQRLVRAYRMLTDSRFADRSITSVAFGAGFGDLSYFNRAFRRCYGRTPSEVRAEAGRHAGM
jgi:AraC-like DNA-binding protein